ncbi:hypothetical protein OROMI_018293 [Orobanche minor]
MTRSLRNVLAIKSYQNQVQVVVRNYILADPYIPYTSVVDGMLTFKLVSELNQLTSILYFQSYNGLTKIQRIEWNNRRFHLHAVFISAMSLYFVFWSDLFSDHNSTGLITFRNSPLSTFAIGL